MNIWLLDPAQLTPYYNLALCSALAQAGCAVRYITSRYLYDDALPPGQGFTTDELYFPGLHCAALRRRSRLRQTLRGLAYPFGHLQLAQQLGARRPAILHIQWSRLPRLDIRLIRAAQASGVRVVHTIHDVIPLYAPRASTAPLAAVYTQCDAVVVHAEANRRDFLATYPQVDPARVHVIPHLALPYTALPADASKARARAELGLPPDAPIIAFQGSIRRYKGVDILVEAFRLAQGQRPDLHLLIAGLPETSEDVALLAQAGQWPNVHITNGYLPHGDLWRYNLAADVLVLPYRQISQSGALLTTMGFGRPLIVSALGALPETLDGNGWVVPPENPQALCEAILEALSDPNRLAAMGARSLQLVHERHGGSAVAARSITLYEALLAESG